MSAAADLFQSDDEFRFLTSDAARVGRDGPLPTVSRVSTRLPDRRAVSGLALDGDHTPHLVALHGAGLNAHSFDPMLLALDRPALALDLPGHGRSEWRDDADYSPAALADDIGAALEQRAVPPVALVGHSLGGLTAAIVAAERRNLVRMVILIDITPGISPARDTASVREFIQGQRDFGSVDEIVERARQFGIGRDPDALARGISLNTRRRADGRLEWVHHLAHLDPAHTSAPGDSRPHDAIWEPLESLRQAGTPVALISADAGILTAELLEEWRGRMPESEVVTLAGPHNLHEAAPRRLAHAIDEILVNGGFPRRTAV